MTWPPDLPRIVLPKGWPATVKTALVHAISLAHLAIIQARGWAANSINARVRLAARLEQAQAEIALLREEIRIKDARMALIAPQRRSHYPPTERMAILQLKAARGWSMAQTARAFLLTPPTIAEWTHRIDEAGPQALVQLRRPVNRFPDFVRLLVRRLKVLCPRMGKVRIAQLLARAGLHLGATTVRRMLAESPAPPRADCAGREESDPAPGREVTARRPNHVWHVDLTAVPTAAGFAVPWLPFAFSPAPQRWPFCWWVAAVVDHFSRRVMGLAVFDRQPTSVQVRAFLGRTVSKAGKTPRYIICDKGSQFWCGGFRAWGKRRGVRPRFGAVGRHGSIAVVERFIRSMKDECTRRLLIPMRRRAFRKELCLYAEWYNEHRPHQALDGRTPDEVYYDRSPANEAPRFEPRPHWPKGSPCASPQAPPRGEPAARLQLVVRHHGGRRHLPTIQLRQVA